MAEGSEMLDLIVHPVVEDREGAAVLQPSSREHRHLLQPRKRFAFSLLLRLPRPHGARHRNIPFKTGLHPCAC